MKIKIFIDPFVNIYYSGFYILGLYEKFGKKNVFFCSTPFETLKSRGANFDFIIEKEGKQTKYTINTNDFFDIEKESYEWCDVYGNVNANFEKTPMEFHSKLVSLVPSFGIRLWNLEETIFYAGLNAFKAKGNTNLRKFFGKYKRQWLIRLPYSMYFPVYDLKQSNFYIFHLSTLWYNDEWNRNDEGVNKIRANFINACKSIDNVQFEGGLATSDISKVNPYFIPLIFQGTISIKEYIEKIKKSVLVFNTPAFWSCHGWKLGEYLALGKAIISTPLSNDLPAPLVHGENIHIVDNDIEEFKKAILLIASDKNYRRKLEKGAREYWEKYGTPIKSLELLGI